MEERHGRLDGVLHIWTKKERMETKMMVTTSQLTLSSSKDHLELLILEYLVIKVFILKVQVSNKHQL